MTTQLVARVDEQLVAAVDRLIAEGALTSRSEAVRRGLEVLVDQHRRRAVGKAIVDGYRREPQTPEEVGWADEATRQMIAQEPW